MTVGLDGIEIEPTAAPAGAASVPDRILHLINQAIVLASSVALVVAAFVLTYSVASRYFFHFSTDWQDELSVFLIVGAVFMSSAAIQARRGHVGIEAIAGLLSPRANRIRMFLVDLASSCSAAFSRGNRGYCWRRPGWRISIPARPGRRRCGFPIC